MLVEKQLLGVKGVISFTFNMRQHRCVLRIRNEVNPEVRKKYIVDWIMDSAMVMPNFFMAILVTQITQI